jgi:hypothetical protein
MKKVLLLGLGASFLQSALALALDPPMPVAAPAPGFQVESATVQDAASAGIDVGRIFGPGKTDNARVWGGTEFLMWWTSKVPVNTPLFSQANNLAADPTAGQVGSANTVFLLGEHSYDLGTRYGGRATVGGWLDSASTIGIEGNYLYIAPTSTTRTAGSSGTLSSPYVGVPYLNTQTGNKDYLVLGGYFGSPAPNTTYLRLSNQLQGGELNLLGRLVRTDSLSVTGLAGFRYVNFKENLDFGSSFTEPAFGFAQASYDSFHATNNFYGGNIGLRGEYRLGSFFIEATAKVAMGTMQEAMDIAGSTVLVNPFPPAPSGTYAGGVFAQASNIGHHTHNAFCVVPETDLKLGFNITRNIQCFVGYDVLYLSDVARPGTAIDHSINLSQNALYGPATGPPAPNFSFNQTSFWAQGVNFGVVIKF